MKMTYCSCCNAEVTMPSFKDRRPYGYSCFRKLFGKGTKPIQYVEVECKTIIRKWADLKSTLSEEGWAMKKDHFTIIYKYSFQTVKKAFMSESEFAIQDLDGKFWVPKTDVIGAAKRLKNKLELGVDDLTHEFK